MSKLLRSSLQINGADSRTETLDGKECLVVPAIAMQEGVMNNIFYPAEEINAYPETWNGRPVTINHPVDANNNFISAGNAKVIETQAIGIVLNAKTEDSKLKCDFYLDIEKCNRINRDDIITHFEDGNMMECSTGLFTDDVLKAGVDRTKIKNYAMKHNKKNLNFRTNVFNDKPFSSIAINFRPDHIALLPDEVGACSIEDGCGALRNNQKENCDCGCADCVAKLNEGSSNMSKLTNLDYKSKSELTGQLNHIWHHAKKNNLKLNELSHDDIRSQIRGEVYDAMKPSEDEWIWIVEVYTDTFVFEWQGSYYRMSYSVTSDIVSIGDEMTEVVRTTSYNPVASPVSSNADSTGEAEQPSANSNKENPLNKEDLINSLIANSNNQFTEEDREFLSGLEADRLAKFNAKADDDMEENKEDEEMKDSKSSKSNSNTDAGAENVVPDGYVPVEKFNELEAKVNAIVDEPLKEMRAKVVANTDLTEAMVEKLSAEEVKALADNIRPNASYAGRASANIEGGSKTSSRLSIWGNTDDNTQTDSAESREKVVNG